MISLLFFSSSSEARILAACVPLLNFLRLLSVGTGVLEDRGLVLSVSRSGDRSELLKVRRAFVPDEIIK